MRVFLALIFPVILSTIAFADLDHAPMLNDQQVNVIQDAEPEAQSFALFRKKKKLKSSNRVKRRNKSMAKKFKRKNDDTLRR